LRLPAGRGGAKARPGSLTIAFAAASTVLDPIKYSAGVDHYFVSQMFEQLVRPHPSLKTVNWLAESRRVIPNGASPSSTSASAKASSSTTAIP
jgi:peptide/nickel transport system substrate-binding protein